MITDLHEAWLWMAEHIDTAARDYRTKHPDHEPAFCVCPEIEQASGMYNVYRRGPAALSVNVADEMLARIRLDLVTREDWPWGTPSAYGDGCDNEEEAENTDARILACLMFAWEAAG